MNFLEYLSIFGRFSVQDSPDKIVVKQHDYLGRFLKFLAMSLFVLIILIIPIFINDLGSFLIKGKKEILAIIILVYVAYIIFDRLFLKSSPSELIIDRAGQKITYNGIELKVADIDFAEPGRVLRRFGCYNYYLTFYPKVNGVGLDEKADDNVKESVVESIFWPLAHTKSFMVYLANEINQMTIKRKHIENKTEMSDILHLLYTLAIVALFSTLIWFV